MINVIYVIYGMIYLVPLEVINVGMSRRDMKVGQIETKMVGIDRKALGQIFEDFLWFIKLKNSAQITQQSLSNIQDVAVPQNDHKNTAHLEVQNHVFTLMTKSEL